MRVIEIEGTVRKKLGKKDAQRLRKDDQVPCVMYGGDETVHFYASLKQFFKLVYTPHAHLVDFSIDGKKYKAALKDIQFHPVSDKIHHIDFIQVFEDKDITMDIPVILEGSAIGVKNGGKLRVRRRVLQVKGLPKHLPDELTINIDDLDIGQTITISDLQFDNVELTEPSTALVCAVISSRAAAKGMELTEPGEAVEGEAAEGEAAEGEATGEEGEEAKEESGEGKE